VVWSHVLVQLVLPITTNCASVTYLLLELSAISAVVASAQAVTKPLASYVIFVLVAQVIAAFSSTFQSSAVCKSVCVESVHVILPHVVLPHIVISQAHNKLIPFTVLIFVQEINVACLAFNAVCKSVWSESNQPISPQVTEPHQGESLVLIIVVCCIILFSCFFGFPIFIQFSMVFIYNEYYNNIQNLSIN
jgi:hypothetical protein